jgi:hypothetical protein
MASLRFFGFLLLALLAGCGTLSSPRPVSGPTPATIDRDQLLTFVAACHLLRVSQTSDPSVTDATVIAAIKKYGYSIDEVLSRSEVLLRVSSFNRRDLARSGAASCRRLASLTGVRPDRVRLAQPGRVREKWLRVSGEMKEGFANRVITEIRRLRPVGLVIDSPGGSVYEARRLGRYLRANGLSTAVDKSCLSACVDVLAGGVERYITPGAILGIHQSRAPKELSSHEGGQAYVAGSALYLREMGVDDILALLAAAVPHQNIFLISTDEALQTRLATGVIRSL